MKNPRDSRRIMSFFDDQMLPRHTALVRKEALRQVQFPVIDPRFFDDQNLLDCDLPRALI
jgi:hypothetical protein